MASYEPVRPIPKSQQTSSSEVLHSVTRHNSPSPADRPSQQDRKYIGLSSGIGILSKLLSDLRLPHCTPWPHLAVDSAIKDMSLLDHVPSLPIPSRKSCSDMLALYSKVVSPIYQLYSEEDLAKILDEIFLTGSIARRDISETTLNSFALILGHAAIIMSRTMPALEEFVVRCVRFTRTGLAGVLQKPSLRGVKMILAIIIINISKELPDPIWYTLGLATCMCMDLGLQNKRPEKMNATEAEIDEEDEIRRVFWTAYCLDRGMSLTFGRPIFYNESGISCPYPRHVPPHILARYKIRRLQSRIIQTRLQLERFGSLPYPTSQELQHLQELQIWQNEVEKAGSTASGVSTLSYIVQEQITQAGNTELLLHRRGLHVGDPNAIARSLTVIFQNLEIYRTEAIQISIVEGVLLVQDLFLNYVTMLFIYRFAPLIAQQQGLDAQKLKHWAEVGEMLFGQLSNRWRIAAESLQLLNSIMARI